MLNYLGPNIGNGPLPPQLPPATPGTMPQGVPGIAPNPAPLPNAHIGRAPGLHPSAHGPAPAPEHILSHILKHAAGGGAAPPVHPEYATTTQSDGSILLHRKNPDGSHGPVVKVLPPIKPHATAATGGGAPPTAG